MTFAASDETMSRHDLCDRTSVSEHVVALRLWDRYNDF